MTVQHNRHEREPDGTQYDHSRHGASHGAGMAHGAHTADTPDTEHSEHAHQMHHEQADAPHGGHGGHDSHAGHSEEMFKRPFWVSLLLTIPILYYAHLFQELLGYTAPAFPGSEYLGLLLGSIVYWYGGWVFLTGAVGELHARQPGMMTLVALAITTAYAYSVAITVGIVAGMDFYWELATLVTIMLLGHWMEVRAGASPG
jgi:Cu2+-exporting ATPase